MLKRILDDQYITEAEYQQAMNEEPRISTKELPSLKKAPDFVEHVRKYVEAKYGVDALCKEGLQVYTTVDLEQTKIARAESHSVPPIFVKRIVDRHGKVLEEHNAPILKGASVQGD